MVKLPCFIDFEASSLAVESYPIEVAWSLEDGSIESHLINPQQVVAWTDWDPKSEEIHGIRREQLITEGETPCAVCCRMNDQLSGKVLYSDAPRFDRRWLFKLFSGCEGCKPEFQIEWIDGLLLSVLCEGVPDRIYAMLNIQSSKLTARERKSRRHRAAWDVEYLIELWKTATEKQDERK
jgi:hypothetical protein